MRRRHGLALALTALLAIAAQAAPPLAGVKRVVLSNAAGEQLHIANVSFTPAGEGRWQFDLMLERERFGEYFLAMRPFKCLAGATQHLCLFPYGEERTITRDDLAPLEYALMFLRKKPAELHVNSANGIYYKLAWTNKGLAGTLFDVDFDPIVVPRGERRRPIRAEHLLPAHEGSHWLPRLAIE